MNHDSQATYCIVNGQLVSTADAVISIQDRGFRFGDGIFETIAVKNGVPYQFDWHMTRLKNGLSAIKIYFNISILRDYARALLHKNKLSDGILRIQVTRGIGSQGYLPISGKANYVVETTLKPVLPVQPISLWLSSYQKISADALPVQYKLCQGLNSTLARMEAAENNCFDALLINAEKQLCETSSGNIFWQKNDVLYTPSLSCGVLEGSTRAAIMRLFPVMESTATLETLVQAEAVCITNTAWGALAVGSLQPKNLHWKSEHLADLFNKVLEEDKLSYCKTHHQEWQMKLE